MARNWNENKASEMSLASDTKGRPNCCYVDTRVDKLARPRLFHTARGLCVSREAL